jgi:hypothetical protein
MCRCRSLLIACGAGWLWLAAGVVAVRAQPEAMPATVLSADDSTAPRDAPGPVVATVVPEPAVGLDAAKGDSPIFADTKIGTVPAAAGPYLAPPEAAAMGPPPSIECFGPWQWQIFPDGLMYKSYLASLEESRFAGQWVHDDRLGWIWNATLGGNVGLLRYGTEDPLWPEGWQLDLDGAAFPELAADWTLVTTDFRLGVPLTARVGPWEGKFGYYHLCAHLGDEYLLEHPECVRLGYIRDALVLGVACRPLPDWRLYGEADWAFHTEGGARPWEFQFGVEFSPARPTGFYGAPFLAVNGAIREEVDYGGNVTVEAGWQWRSVTGRLARVGLQYFDGYSDEREFYHDREELLGLGLWYDY